MKLFGKTADALYEQLQNKCNVSVDVSEYKT